MEAAAKEPCFLRSERSPVFTRFCERVYGRMLNQYGTADMAQLDLLLESLALKPTSHVLDAGCGTGLTTQYLCEKSGSRFTGLDKSERSIARGLERAALPGRLTFTIGTMDALEFPPASFDAVVSIESLYFPKDLASTVGQFKALLRPGGRMGLFFTHFGEDPSTPESTKLGVALAGHGLTFTTHDLTEQDRRFWQRAKDVGESLKGEAEAEGNDDLLHLGETNVVLGMIAKGGHARYLYSVRMSS